jgi:hypothetical protein
MCLRKGCELLQYIYWTEAVENEHLQRLGSISQSIEAYEASPFRSFLGMLASNRLCQLAIDL